MALAPTECCLCSGSLHERRPYLCTSGVAFAEEHPLFPYCDAAMHVDCLEQWPHRAEFARGYFDEWRAQHEALGTVLAEGPGWMLACGIGDAGRDPHHAEVHFSDWPCRLYSRWEEWAAFVAGGYREKAKGAVLESASRAMHEVASIAADVDSLRALWLHAWRHAEYEGAACTVARDRASPSAAAGKPPLIATLEASGLDAQPLERAEATRFFKLWCETFLEPVRLRTGTFCYRGYHWHAFSYEMVEAVGGSAAWKNYRRLAPVPVLIIPESWSRGCGVRCSGPQLPDLSDLHDDLYVFPESMDWTMAFTHEQPEFGPYFARRE